VPDRERPPLLVVSDRARAAERVRLEEQARTAGVELRFRSRVSQAELVAIYSAARLVLYAPYREPFGFVPLEAMACARPVLGVDEGGIPESVVNGETGFIEGRDVARFGARIEELLRDTAATESVAARASVLVRERWSWQRSVVELEALCMNAAAAVTSSPLQGT
jgi:glycosyltransferase involved in cell wall biosynthesis